MAAKIPAILHPFRARDHGIAIDLRGDSGGFSVSEPFWSSSIRSRSIRERCSRLYDPNLVIGKRDKSVGQLYLGHVTAHAVRFRDRAEFSLGL